MFVERKAEKLPSRKLKMKNPSVNIIRGKIPAAHEKAVDLLLNIRMQWKCSPSASAKCIVMNGSVLDYEWCIEQWNSSESRNRAENHILHIEQSNNDLGTSQTGSKYVWASNLLPCSLFTWLWILWLLETVLMQTILFPGFCNWPTECFEFARFFSKIKFLFKSYQNSVWLAFFPHLLNFLNNCPLVGLLLWCNHVYQP